MAQLHNEGAFSHNKDPELSPPQCIMCFFFLLLFWQSQDMYSLRATRNRVFLISFSKPAMPQKNRDMSAYHMYFLKFCYVLNRAYNSMQGSLLCHVWMSRGSLANVGRVGVTTCNFSGGFWRGGTVRVSPSLQNNPLLLIIRSIQLGW